jgi:hypothetical protein
MMLFRIEVEIERESGKFASREEIGEKLIEAIEQADLSGLGADGDSEYVISGADVLSNLA